MGQNQTIDDEIAIARQELLRALDFDLYDNAQFVARYICKVCNIVQANKQDLHGGIHANGTIVEITFSNVNVGHTPSVTRSFIFADLQGQTRKGKAADVYVMAGNDNGTLRYFVVPAHKVGKRTRITIAIQPRIYRVKGKWLEYEVSIAKLERSIVEQGAINKNLESNTDSA